MKCGGRIRGGIIFYVLATLSVLRCVAADYYFNSAGNDSNDGLTPASAWRTTTNANLRSFADGDRLLFAAGQSFAGGILLDRTDGGNATKPIVITSYGDGRGTIDGQLTNAITINDRAGIIISNLNVVGAGPHANTGDGIAFYSTLPGNTNLPMIVVDHIDASGFGGAGVCLVTWNGRASYHDVWILNSAMHDNRTVGFFTYALVANTHSNIYVGGCSFYNNFGDTNKQGSGMVFGQVVHGIVEWCVAHDNGKFAGAQGPVGIWAYDCTDITIQFNESYNNRENTYYDGGGFDLDYNTKNSVMQYNYSHENNGPGYMLCCDGNTVSNVIRYNISQNDCRRVHNGAIHSYHGSQRAEIYNNTVYLTESPGDPPAFMLFGPTSNVHVRNNIFQTAGGARIAYIESGQENLLMQGNDYWSSGAPFSIVDSGVEYTNFSSWRAATGRENLNGGLCGFNLDPLFKAAGGGQTLNDATLLKSVTAYNLRGGSPLIDAGFDLRALFGSDTGSRDFAGNAIPQGNAYDLGANELVWSRLLQLAGISWNNGTTTATVTGPVQHTNILEGSSDLSSWTAITNWINTEGAMTFELQNQWTTQRFYRAREMP